ncbi:MAG: ABC transporter permease [Bacteroidetes bacterium]|nr:ABC transporter permease [Bacteroidota bacterium]
MKKILLIAWRNVWRSKTRSLTVMGAMVVGIWALIFVLAFMFSINTGMLKNSIDYQYSHIQIHSTEYKKDREIKFVIPRVLELEKQLSEVDGIQAYSSRILNNGMLATAHGARGVRIIAMDPKQEKLVTKLDKKLVEGSFFEGSKKNQLLISENLADKMNMDIRSRPVITFKGKSGDVGEKYTVVGIFNTGFAKFDELNVLVNRSEFGKSMEMPDAVHEIAIYLEDPNNIEIVRAEVRALNPELEVETWNELAPELNLINEQMYLNMYIFMGIIMLALIFGIINTMLMAVLERVREIGMLMAIGMNKLRVFFMIVAETFMLALIAGPVGLLLGYLTVMVTNSMGIDLSKFSEGLAEYGIDQIVRPVLEDKIYVVLAVNVIVTVILASIYPAIRAMRLNPATAIRKQ